MGRHRELRDKVDFKDPKIMLGAMGAVIAFMLLLIMMLSPKPQEETTAQTETSAQIAANRDMKEAERQRVLEIQKELKEEAARAAKQAEEEARLAEEEKNKPKRETVEQTFDFSEERQREDEEKRRQELDRRLSEELRNGGRRTDTTEESNMSVYDQYPPANSYRRDYNTSRYDNRSYRDNSLSDIERELERLRESNYELQQKLYEMESGQQDGSLAVPPAY